MRARAPEARPAEAGFRLLWPDAAKRVLRGETARLRRLAVHLPPMEPADVARFDDFCEAAAVRRMRERQILLVAYLAVGILAAAPSVWLVATTFRARPAAFLGYVVTAVVLTVPAAWALRGRRIFSPLLVAGFAAAAYAAVWSYLAVTPWWDARWMLLVPPAAGTGIALGAALTFAMIIFALLGRAVMALATRARSGDRQLPVRAFDHLLEVIELLKRTDTRPGDGRREKIDRKLRMASVTLAMMAHGGRPVGRRGRRHRRELQAQQKQINKMLLEPNPLLGLASNDRTLLDQTTTCLLGLCRDQLGDVLRDVREEPIVVVSSPRAGRRRRRLSAEASRRWRRAAGLVGPALILIALNQFGFPMPAPVVGVLGAFCALVLVVGIFFNFYPDPDAFLKVVTNAAKAIQGGVMGARSALGASDAEEPPADEPGDPAGEPADPAGESGEPAAVPEQRDGVDDKPSADRA
ncbi:hypothetical protein KOI35_32470 [Actinoplanes bogorensis]|uniref:Uncharacterized protein n=1 Tax=Paractinoplanes bogorensis TaxID=1610840 RepID=A0ABS5YXR3_9ACTN|nr:hypothetical protein [Actinoplanes bogorensis]MBU2668237.1 hypothetical protein [Actinoplanes bogorensis]